MKNITSSLNGLTSSLFISVGLTQIAEKFDPVSSRPTEQAAQAHGPSYCIPTNFTPKPRR